MRAAWILGAGLVGVVLTATAFAAPAGWHASMDDGLAAAAKSGRPLLVVTAWKSGV